jgi:hypothetical protein
MVGREFKTKDQAPARPRGGLRAWSSSAVVDGSTRPCGGHGTLPLLPAAAALGVAGCRAAARLQLTHARGREGLAMRGA